MTNKVDDAWLEAQMKAYASQAQALIEQDPSLRLASRWWVPIRQKAAQTGFIKGRHKLKPTVQDGWIGWRIVRLKQLHVMTARHDIPSKQECHDKTIRHDNVRTAKLDIRITPSLLSKITKAASSAGMTRTAYVEHALRRALQDPS